MSDSCRPDPGGFRAILTRGFSLLEMLVVLAILSVMVALIAPRLASTVQAVQTSGDRAEVVRQIDRLPVLARTSGQALVFDQGQPLVHEGIVMPEGWIAIAVTPVLVAANGICSAATLRVSGAGVTEEWRVFAPDCRVAGDA